MPTTMFPAIHRNGSTARSTSPRLSARLPLMGLALAIALLALWGGLVHLGWPWEPLLNVLPDIHGPLMVGGFLGTVIGMERAVALGARWGYLGPCLTALGAVLLITGTPPALGEALITLGSGVLIVIFFFLLKRQTALFAVVMTLGAASWFAGNVLWLLGGRIDGLVLWWMGFPVLTIAGERLEMNRLLRPSRRSRAIFLAAVGLFAAGLLVSRISPGEGMRWGGAGLILLAVWFSLNDIARRTIRQQGLPRFVAVCLLSGYAWLAVSGALAVLYGTSLPGLTYDAILHALFLGFVLSMIFGHAPVIFPAVLGVPLPFQEQLYLPVVLLHASLFLRVGADLAEWWDGRLWGGLLNAAAFVLFLGLAASGMLAGKLAGHSACSSAPPDARRPDNGHKI